MEARPRTRHRAGLFVLLASLVACGETPGGAGAAGSSDARPIALGVPETEAALDTTPSLRIGERSGDPHLEFGRVKDVRLGSDGSLYVLDLQARSLRRYGDDGRYLATLGGPGPGPGEFRLPYALDVEDDTVRVFDLRAPRISAFSPDGELLDSHPVEPVPSSGWPVAFERLASGGWLHLRESIPERRRGEVENDARVRSHARFVVWERASGRWRTILETAGGEARIHVRPGREPALVQAPYPARPLWRAALRRGFWYLDSRRGPLFHLGRDGDTLARYRIGWEGPAVGDADREAFLEPSHIEDPDLRRRIRARRRGAPFPDREPAVRRLLVADGGDLWISPTLDDPDNRRWYVFRATGEAHFRVTTPARFRLEQVVGDTLVGVTTDSLDVPYVSVLSMEG